MSPSRRFQDIARTSRPGGLRSRGLLGTAALAAAACFSAPALGQPIFNETEPNDSKYAANGPFIMSPGDMIIGMTTGSSTLTAGNGSADNFIVQTTPRELGIYRHRLVITTSGTAGHTGTIRGLTQTSRVINPGSDAAMQTSSATSSPPRFNQWYGFGKEEQIYYRVTGTASTTADYVATLETIPVPVIDAGTMYQGFITIDRPAGVTTDIDFWVYDSELNAIPTYGNDSPNTLTRSYTPGVYYIAYTNNNFANDQPAPADDTTTGPNVLDFPNVAANSSTTVFPSLAVQLTDAFESVAVSAPKSEPFEVVWVRFTVTDVAPSNGACCFQYTCSIMTPSGCSAGGGTYQGDSTVCGSCPPAPPGVFVETEPNDSKAEANGPVILQAGQSIAGRATGAALLGGDNSADYFLVRTAPAALNIYQHRLVITTMGTEGHVGTIRGLTQTTGVINPGTDAQLQASLPTTSPPRHIQWYGFGKEEQIYFRVAGIATTTADYLATLETTTVPVIDIGTFYNGSITIDQPAGLSIDLDFWVYDDQLNAIPTYGNDGPNLLTREYSPGTYYIAFADYNFANDQPAPIDDTFRGENVLDFPNAASTSSSTLRPTMAVRVTDAFDSVTVPTPKNNPFEVVWLRFTVTSVAPPAGACCYPNFGCTVTRESTCVAAGGAYQGNDTVCGDCPPPPPGTFPEAEPNDNKAMANPVMGMEHGNLILGRSTGSAATPGDNSIDYFLIKTAPAALGIYQHRLVLTTSGAVGHVGTIRGLTQSAGVINLASDAVVQASSTLTTPPRFNQWYGFGKEEQIYYSVAGTSTTTGDYFATLETTPVMALDMPGSFLPGTITIDRPTGVTADVDFWVYDAQFNAIPGYGNDGPNELIREYQPGTYYVAWTNWNFANDQPAPPDDTFQAENVMDFPNVAVCNSTTLLPTLAIRITDSSMVENVLPTPKNNPYEIVWVRFVVAGGTSCPPDWNNDDVVNSQDISAFITDWLASVNQGTLVADFNGDGQVNSTDISAFITAWLDAVNNGC